LSGAEPSRFEEGLLTISFPASAEITKNKCEDNGRAEAIEAILGRFLARDVRLKFEMAAGEKVEPEQAQDGFTIRRRIENEIMKDPAVKTVLRGLGATITGIEGNKDN
jgi:hypothetical protein